MTEIIPLDQVNLSNQYVVPPEVILKERKKRTIKPKLVTYGRATYYLSVDSMRWLEEKKGKSASKLLEQLLTHARKTNWSPKNER
jgi:hypothetical protein